MCNLITLSLEGYTGNTPPPSPQPSRLQHLNGPVTQQPRLTVIHVLLVSKGPGWWSTFQGCLESVCDHSSMCTHVYNWAFERLMCSGFYGYMPRWCQSRFHSSVAFCVMGLPGGARFSRKHLHQLLVWATGVQQFVSFCPCPALSIYFFSFFPPTVPVVLRWIMVGVTEMAAAPREEEEEGEDTPDYWSYISFI